MEEFTLDRPSTFPVGTSVGLYVAEDVHDPEGGPIGKALATKIVGFKEEKEEKVILDETKTAITFKELSVRNYVAAGQVDGKWRYVRFVPGKMGASLKPPQRYPGHGAG